MFLGEYSYSVDEKGRLAVPPGFRRALGRSAVVTRGLDQCVFLFPLSSWKTLAERLAKLPISQANTRAFARFLLAGAYPVTFDRQGRVAVPEPLRTYAKLRRKVVVAGVYSRIELWDATAWARYRRGTEVKSNAIAEALGNLGI